MNISAPFIHRPIATALLMVGLLVGGLVSYPLLPVAALPNVNYPTLQVTAQLPGGLDERINHAKIEVLPVVQPGAADVPVIEAEAEGPDQPERGPGRDVPVGIGREQRPRPGRACRNRRFDVARLAEPPTVAAEPAGLHPAEVPGRAVVQTD